MKRKTHWINPVISILTAPALLIGFLLLFAACYWRGFVDGRRVYHNKDIACVAYKGRFNCKIMEEYDDGLSGIHRK